MDTTGDSHSLYVHICVYYNMLYGLLQYINISYLKECLIVTNALNLWKLLVGITITTIYGDDGCTYEVTSKVTTTD